MNITFLGTGTSQGVPMIGCDCAVCLSDDPRDKRTRSSIYVETPEAAWAVDTGPEFRVQCLRERVRRMDAVVYTHAHTDHIMGFDDLRPFCKPDTKFPIYASQETMDHLVRVFTFAFHPPLTVAGYIQPDARVINAPFQIGDTTLTPLPLQHGRTVVNGYLFERGGRPVLAYLSDCKVVPEAALDRLRGVETLIIDALRYREHPTHMNIEEALAVRERVQAQRTWFTHICHELSHAQTDAALPEGVRLAHDGLKIAL